MKRQTNKGAVMAILGILILVVIISSLVYFAQNKGKFSEPEIKIPDTEVILSKINMYELGNSGIDGITTFASIGNKVRIDINLNGVPVGIPQPANIHEGICTQTGAVLYPLNNLINGISKTEFDIENSKKLLEATSSISVNTHLNINDLSIVSCGDLFNTLLSTSSDKSI